MYIIDTIAAGSCAVTVHMPDDMPVMKAGVIAMPIMSVMMSVAIAEGPQPGEYVKCTVALATGMFAESSVRKLNDGAIIPAGVMSPMVESMNWIIVAIWAAAGIAAAAE